MPVRQLAYVNAADDKLIVNIKKVVVMAYSELIKNFDKIRSYVREFYIYGFKSRDGYDKKSGRSYDDERRRLESWFEDYIGFSKKEEKKNFYIAIDSRSSQHNPLYKAWKAKSFTDGDISLHFIIFDILHSEKTALTLGEIADKIDNEYLSEFENARFFDESTIRKKLKEYVSLGLIEMQKEGRNVYYRRSKKCSLNGSDALNFYSEIAPCGVVGSFLLDRENNPNSFFRFKHHYINSAVDSEILAKSFLAMKHKSTVNIVSVSKKGNRQVYSGLVPLKVFISVQSGRQYLMTYTEKQRRMRAFRLDYILDITEKERAYRFDELRTVLDKVREKIWGVSVDGKSGRTETVEFTLHIGSGEQHILERLYREKRCGRIEIIDEHTARFFAEVFDSSELVPWIRTFICRIVDIRFSNKMLQRQFIQDMNEMYEMYGIVNPKN